MKPVIKQRGRARTGLRAVQGGLVTVRPVMVWETMTSSPEIMTVRWQSGKMNRDEKNEAPSQGASFRSWPPGHAV